MSYGLALIVLGLFQILIDDGSIKNSDLIELKFEGLWCMSWEVICGACYSASAYQVRCVEYGCLKFVSGYHVVSSKPNYTWVQNLSGITL